MNCLEIFKAISIIIASGVAVYGINSWQRELRGKRKMELAEEILALFYQAFDVINYMRFPGAGVFGDEGKSRKQEKNETEDEKKARDNAYILFERYQPEKEIFSRLQTLRYRFMAVFGKDSGKPFEELRKLINRIFLSARRLARLWAEDPKKIRTEIERERHFKSIEKEEAIFWENSIEEDQIRKELNQILDNIEKLCTPILLKEKKSFFKKFLKAPNNRSTGRKS